MVTLNEGIAVNVKYPKVVFDVFIETTVQVLRLKLNSGEVKFSPADAQYIQAAHEWIVQGKTLSSAQAAVINCIREKK